MVHPVRADLGMAEQQLDHHHLALVSFRVRGRARIRVRVRVRVEVRVEVRVRAARPTPMLARRLWPRRRWSEAERSPRTSEGDVARCREMWGDVGEI